MNVLWQDNVASFLGASSLGAGGFAGSLGDVGAPWFASGDGGVFSGQPVLWWDNGADTPSGASGLTGFASFDSGGRTGGWLSTGAATFAGVGLIDGRLLWAESSGGASTWLATNPGAGRFDLSALDPTSALWLQSTGDFAGRGDTWLTESSTLLWTSGAGEPPLTPPVTLDSLHLAGNFAGPAFPALGAEHVVWTDPATATGLTAGPTLFDVAPTPAMTGVGAGVSSSSGLPISGVGSEP
jgi:hypothetical protein